MNSLKAIEATILLDLLKDINANKINIQVEEVKLITNNKLLNTIEIKSYLF